MSRRFARKLRNASFIAAVAASASICAAEDAKSAPKAVTTRDTKDAKAPQQAQKSAPVEVKNFKPFTGKVTGSHVRMRLTADLDGPIVSELSKDEHLVVKGERGDFYCVEAPSQTKAYVFRSFVLDQVVEGHHVNVRLAPDLDAPVIAHLNTGDRVEGKLCETNNKWLEIHVPKSVSFYVSKDLIENVGGPDFKATRDARLTEVTRLLESAQTFAQSEMLKPFDDINFEKISHQYQKMAQDFSDSPQHAEKAKAELYKLQESYLKKKIAYLESRASQISSKSQEMSPSTPVAQAIDMSITERMEVWAAIEKSFFAEWSRANPDKNIKDFYEAQKTSAISLTGTLEPYFESIKSKPGDYLLRDKDVPVAILYSANVNLQNFTGKKVQILGVSRPNNYFAFPAYCVIEIK